MVVSGRCPARAGEVMLPRQAASRLRLGRSSRLGAYVQGERASSPNLPTTETVVGVYVARNQSDPYWAGEQTAFITAALESDRTTDRVPAVLTVPATFDAVAAQYPNGERPLGFATSTRLVDVGSVRLADLPQVRREVSQAQASLASASTNDLVLELRDNLPYQFDRALHDGHQLARATTVVLAQLLLLSGCVLLLVVAGSATARAPEVAAARLRGLRTRTLVGLAVAEPLVLVAVGAPLGGVLAWLLVKGMAAGALVPGTPVAVPAGALGTMLIALGAVMLAVLVVCGRVLGRPVLDLWQRTVKPPARGALVVDLVVAGTAVLVATGCVRAGGPWVLLVPVPVAVVVALVGLRVLPLVVAPALRRTRARRKLASFLAVRQLVRRREGAWLVALLVVAFGLAATATTAWSVARRAAAVRAGTEVGAPRVLVVQPDVRHPELDLRAAVRAADPGGRQAMAVLEYLPFQGDPGGRLLAVDSSRLAAVAAWDDTVVGAPVSTVLRAITVTGGSVPAAVVTRAVHADPLSALAPGAPAGGAVVTGVDGSQHPVIVRGVVAALPRALSRGTIVDWDAVAAIPSSRIVATYEIWLSVTDPALEGRLQAQGLTVLSADDAAQHRTLLSRQGPALSVLLSLVVAVIALVLAAGTTLFQVLTSARRRGWELAALGALGVRADVLRRASRGEALLLLGAGLVLGSAAGAIACALTLPSLPLFAESADSSTTVGGVSGGVDVQVPLTPGPLALGILLAAALLLVTVTAAAVGRVLQRAADPARLREVQA